MCNKPFASSLFPLNPLEDLAELIFWHCEFESNFRHAYHKVCLPLKRKTKTAAGDTLFFYVLKKIRLDVLCESSVPLRIHMKYQVLFSLKNNEKIYL